jgi:hypothetical protein
MARDNKDAIPILRIRKGDSLKTIYAKARKAFSAEDLQRYTELEPMIPVEQIIAEMEAIHREESQKKRKKKRASCATRG